MCSCNPFRAGALLKGQVVANCCSPAGGAPAVQSAAGLSAAGDHDGSTAASSSPGGRVFGCSRHRTRWRGGRAVCRAAGAGTGSSRGGWCQRWPAGSSCQHAAATAPAAGSRWPTVHRAAGGGQRRRRARGAGAEAQVGAGERVGGGRQGLRAVCAVQGEHGLAGGWRAAAGGTAMSCCYIEGRMA